MEVRIWAFAKYMFGSWETEKKERILNFRILSSSLISLQSRWENPNSLFSFMYFPSSWSVTMISAMVFCLISFLFWPNETEDEKNPKILLIINLPQFLDSLYLRNRQIKSEKKSIRKRFSWVTFKWIGNCPSLWSQNGREDHYHDIKM